jgi:hypothetical protein
MQILLISGIAFAIVAVLFALQNNVPVTVSFFAWSFDASPALIGSQWTGKRLKRQVAGLEEQNRAQQQRLAELDAQLESLLAAQALDPAVPKQEQKPYVGLKALMTGTATDTTKP